MERSSERLYTRDRTRIREHQPTRFDHMKLVFMGTPDFAVPCLEALAEAGHDIRTVVTQPDRPKGRRRTPQPSPVKEAAVARGLPVYQPQRVNKPDVLPRIRDLEPDAIVVVAYGQKLPRELLELPPWGCINVHASLLPKYRGAAPIQAVLLAGEEETGVTIMQMVEAMDAGDILAQARTPIAPDENAGQLHDRLAELSAPVLVDTFAKLVHGQLTPQPQNHAEATLAPKFSKADGVVDWQRDAEYLARFVRAVTPWPGAATEIVTAESSKPIRVALLAACATRDSCTGDASHGTVLQVSDAGIEVATGRGALLITRLQQSGKKPHDAAEFLRGRPVQAGDRFQASDQ